MNENQINDVEDTNVYDAIEAIKNAEINPYAPDGCIDSTGEYVIF